MTGGAFSDFIVRANVRFGSKADGLEGAAISLKWVFYVGLHTVP